MKIQHFFSWRQTTAALLIAAQVLGLLGPITPTALAAVAGDVVITEIHADPSAVADANGEWVELKNTTNSLVSLTGWTLDDGNGALSLTGASIPAGGYAVVGVDGNSSTNGGVAVDVAVALNLNNAGNTLILKDNTNATIDSVSYDAATGGKSWSLDDPNLNNASTASNWHTETINTFGSGDYGTPRSGNSPAQVTGFDAVNGTDTTALSWNAVTGATDYVVYRGGTLLKTVAGTSTTDDLDGSLDLSGVTITATSTATSSVDVSWNAASAVSSGNSSYTVAARRSGVEGAASTADTASVTPSITDYELFAVTTADTSVGTTTGALTKQHTPLAANTSNVYKIRAYSADTGWSTLSTNSVTGVSLPATPPDPTVTASYDTTNGYAVTVSAYSPVAGQFAELEIDETSGSSGGSDRSASSATSNYLDTGLAGDTTYTYRVRAKNSAGNYGAWSNPISATTPPAQPTTLSGTPTAASTTSLDWSWTNVSGETGYRVYDGSDTEKFTTVANDVSEAEGSLAANTSYTRYVRAENATGLGQASSTTTKYTAQAAPTSVSFGSVAATSFVATANGTFTNSTSGSTGIFFWIDANTNGSYDGGETNSGWQQGTTWNVTGLTPNTSYTIAAKARNGDAVETSMSSLAQVTLAETPLAPSLDAGTSTVDVTINLGTNPASTEYAIQATSNNQYLQGDGTLGAAAVWKTKAQWETGTVNRLTGLSANTQYGFKVVARNSDTTQTSASATATIFTDALAPIGAPTVGAATAENQLTLSANDTSGNGVSTEYAIRASNGQFVQSNGSLGGSEYWTTLVNWQNKTITGLTANTSYTFTTKARNSELTETAYTAASTAVVTLADAVTGATLTNATDAGDTKLSLAWTIGTTSGIKIEQNSGAGYNTTICDDSNSTPMACGASPLSLTGKNTNTSYTYRFTSYNSANVANTVTLATSNSITTPPAAPAGLTEAAGSSTTQVVWSWTAATGADSYNIYDSGDNLLTNTVATTWTHTPLTKNSASTIYVRSVSVANGTGVKTTTTTRYTDSAIPSSPSGTADSTTQISWSWGVNGNPAGTDFYAESGAGGNSGWVANAVSWINTALTSNTLYTLSVKSRNENDEDSSAITTTRYSGVDVPTDPTFSGVATSSITVSTTVTNSGTAEANFTNETSLGSSGWLGAGVMSWTNSGLTPNTSYSYSATARNGDDSFTSSVSNTTSKYTLAATPAAPTVAVVSAQPTQLSVDPQIGAGNPAGTAYAIAIDTDGDGTSWNTTNFVQADGSVGGSAVWQDDATWGTKTITGLTANTAYRVAVKARNGESVETALGTETALATLASPVTAASATPGYDSVNGYKATISYTIGTTTSVRIRRVNDSTDIYTGALGSFTDTGLAADTLYTYRIYSRNSATTENSNYVEVTATTPPAAPAGLTITAADETSITLDWNDVGTATGYRVYNSSNAQLADVVASTTVIGSLSPNTSYTFYVRAYNANGEGAASGNTSGYTNANAPTGLAGAAASTTAINWSWTVNGNPAGTQFAASDSAGNSQAYTADATSWADTGSTTPLTANTTYTLSVKAKNGAGTPVETATVTTTTATAIETPTTNIAITALTDTGFTATSPDTFTALGAGNSALFFALDNVDQVASVTNQFFFSSLTPDTTYAVKVKARNRDGVLTGYNTAVNVTTYATTPLAPVASGATTTTVAVNPDGTLNNASTTYAIAVDTDGDATSWNTTQYVQADGSLGGVAVYRTDAAWGTTTITGLTSNTLLRVRAVAQNNNADFGATTTIETLPAAPAAPTLALPTATGTLSVTINDGTTNASGNTEYALEVDSDGNGTSFDASQYVQADGTLGGGAVYRTTAAWGTPVSVTGLGDNKNIRIRTLARSATTPANVSSASTAATLVTQAAQVTAFTATDTSVVGAYSASLSWTAGSQTGIRITQATDGVTFSTVICDDITSTPVACGASPRSIASLTAGTTYTFRAESYNSASALNSTAPAQTAPITTGPAGPAAATASAVNSTSITWSWSDVVGATSYDIYDASNNNLIINQVDDGTANDQTYTQSGLTPNTTYSVYVRALNALGTSTASPTASMVTDSATPTGLAASAQTVSGLTLSWGANGNPAGTEYCASDNAATPNESGAGCATTADTTVGTGWTADLLSWANAGTTTPLTANTSYTFSVKSRDSTRTQSAAATLAAYTGIETPSVPTLSGATTTTLTVATGGVTNAGVADFYFNNTTATTNSGWLAPAGTTSWTNSGLTPGKAYSYTATARNGDDISGGTSAGATFYTLPAAATVTTPSVTGTTATVNFTNGGNDTAATFSIAIAGGTTGYLAADGSVTGSAVWQTHAAWANGVVTATGLTANTSYSFTVTSKNGNADTANSAPATVTTAAATPTVSETSSPSKNNVSWYGSGSSFRFSNTATGVTSYRYLWNTNAATTTAILTDNGWTDLTSDLIFAPGVSGSYYLHLTSYNSSNVAGTDATFGPYNFDKDAPTATTITSATHAETAWSNVTTVTVTLSANDVGGSTLAGYYLVLDQAAATTPTTSNTFQATASHSFTPIVESGTGYYVHAISVDAAGNLGTVDHYGPLYIDTTPPTALSALSVTSPITNTNKAAVTLTGTTEAAATVTVSANDTNGATPAVTGSTTANGLGAFSFTLDTTSLSDGTLTFSLTAADAAGNTSAGSTTATKDVAAPVVTLTAPTAPTTVNAASYTVTGTTDEAATLAFSDGGSATTTAPGFAFSHAFTLTQNAVSNFTVTATDSVGNAGAPTAISTITEDSTPPAAPAGLAWGAATAVASNAASFTLTGTGKALTTATLTLTDSASQTQTTTATVTAGGAISFTLNLSTLADGAITGSMILTDADSQNSTATATPALTKETVLPSATITPTVVSDSATLAVVIADTANNFNLAATSTGVVTYDTVTPPVASTVNITATSGNNYTATLAPLVADTLYYYRLVTTDNAGNSSTSAIGSFRTPVTAAPATGYSGATSTKDLQFTGTTSSPAAGATDDIADLTISSNVGGTTLSDSGATGASIVVPQSTTITTTQNVTSGALTWNGVFLAPTAITASSVISGTKTLSGTSNTITASDILSIYKIGADTTGVRLNLSGNVTITLPATGATTTNAKIITSEDGVTWTEVGTYSISGGSVSFTIDHLSFFAVVAVPNTVSDLSAATASSSSINLSWTAATGATSYAIYRGATQVGTTTSTSYTDTGLSASTSYSYTVKSVSNAATSAASNTATASTSAAPSGGGGGGGSGVAKIVSPVKIDTAKTQPGTNPTTPATADQPKFSDLPATHWAQPFVTDLTSRGVISSEREAFAPEQVANRAELITLALRAFAVAPYTQAHTLSDVKKSDWYSGYAEAATKLGIIGRRADGTFDASRQITRGEALAIVLNASRLPLTLTRAPHQFVDVPADSWLAPYTQFASEAGIINASERFDPDATVTRAVLAKLISAALKKAESFTGRPLEYPGERLLPTQSPASTAISLTESDLAPFLYNLWPGNAHADIARVKKVLAVLGYYQESDFGDRFTTALSQSIIRFQLEQKIILDTGIYGAGLLGQATRRELNKELKNLQAGTSAIAPAVEVEKSDFDPFESELHPGDSGSEVARLQRALAQLGFDSGAASDSFTPALSEAVTQFQIRYIVILDRRWPGAGAVGQATLRRLNKVLSNLKSKL